MSNREKASKQIHTGAQKKIRVKDKGEDWAMSGSDKKNVVNCSFRKARKKSDHATSGKKSTHTEKKSKKKKRLGGDEVRPAGHAHKLKGRRWKGFTRCKKKILHVGNQEGGCSRAVFGKVSTKLRQDKNDKNGEKKSVRIKVEDGRTRSPKIVRKLKTSSWGERKSG